MKAQRLRIAEKKRDHPVHVASATDFAWTDEGEIAAETLVADPKFSLYCFDLERQTALFVEVDDAEEMARAPFLYQGQYELARGLATIPISAFHTLAGRIDRPRDGFIFLHSVGRCGSTLLSKVMQAVPQTYSLSEPDEATQLGRFRATKQLSDEAISQLLYSSTMWRAKPAARLFTSVALKCRSEVMVLADIFARLFPEDRHVFQYRDGISWMRTLFRGWPEDVAIYDDERNRTMEMNWAKSIPLVNEYRREDAPMNPIQIRMLAWVQCMEEYLVLRNAKVPTSAMRYEDLRDYPAGTLRAFFQALHIDDVNWSVIKEVLSRDSQAGTIYDREKRKSQTSELTPELVQDVIDLVATRPKLKTVDVVLPGTLIPNANDSSA